MPVNEVLKRMQEEELWRYIDDLGLSERNHALVSEFIKCDKTYRSLAKEYSISPSCVRQILIRYNVKASRYHSNLLKMGKGEDEAVDESNPLKLPLTKLDTKLVKWNHLGFGKDSTIGDFLEQNPDMAVLKLRPGLGERRIEEIVAALKKYDLEIPEPIYESKPPFVKEGERDLRKKRILRGDNELLEKLLNENLSAYVDRLEMRSEKNRDITKDCMKREMSFEELGEKYGMNRQQIKTAVLSTLLRAKRMKRWEG